MKIQDNFVSKISDPDLSLNQITPSSLLRPHPHIDKIIRHLFITIKVPVMLNTKAKTLKIQRKWDSCTFNFFQSWST